MNWRTPLRGRGKALLFAMGAGITLIPHLAMAQSAAPIRTTAPVAVPDQAPIPLRPAIPNALPEQLELAGTGYAGVRNVVNPTLTPFLPDPAKATGAAVIVAPGGAFRFLSIEAEGYSVARWLADHGIAAFVLKYRTVPVPRDQAGYQAALADFMRNRGPDTGRPLGAPPEAVEDGQAAVRLLRQRAAEWKIDPQKIGFAGYSAGAMTALGVGLAPETDARPNFIAPIYPPMGGRPVPNDAPAMFLAIALDDPLFAKGKPLGLIQSWRDAGRPLEVHLYEKGGHGFSMRPGMHAGALVLPELVAWMKDHGIVKP
ncbi:MAG: alpha/beta hydrolase [Novosphingobium sp.]